jgi:V/A-type H+-transporting ATPase subunit I
MSDVLSYSRILALALSSAVIAMVMNMLGGMVFGTIPVLGVILAIIIYILGHTFNLGMGLLSAYVHDSRLQYIEFFGKFYDGGGYEFKPLSLNLKYVDKVNEKSLN